MGFTLAVVKSSPNISFSIYTKKHILLFSNSLRSNENTLIYFLKQLGNKGKRKFSVSRAAFSCSMLRGNKVTIFLSQIYLYLYNLYPTNATYFGSLCHVLSSWWQQLLEKIYSLRCQNRAMVNDSFANRKTKSCRPLCFGVGILRVASAYAEP